MALEVKNVKINVDKQLISLPRIKFDPTLNLWDQYLRFDFIIPEKFSESVRVQILLDRVHKFKPKLSRPVAYFHLSNINTLMEIAAQSLTCSIILSLLCKNEVRSADIIQAINSAIELLIPRVMDLVSIYIRKVKSRKYQLTLDYLAKEDLK